MGEPPFEEGWVDEVVVMFVVVVEEEEEEGWGGGGGGGSPADGSDSKLKWGGASSVQSAALMAQGASGALGITQAKQLQLNQQLTAEKALTSLRQNSCS
jgi:hypothetical protein